MTSVHPEDRQTSFLPGSPAEEPVAKHAVPPADPGISRTRRRILCLSGEVLEVVSSRGNTFSVIRFLDRETRQVHTVVGPMGPLRPGERVRLSGRWIVDPERGRRFRVEAFATPLPVPPRVLERFLASGLVKGVGTGLAHRVVDDIGPDLCRVLDHEDERRLARVPGVGQARARAILAAWHQDPVTREALLYLLGLGLTPELAARIVRHYGPRTVRAVKQDPYRIARAVRGIGFQRADEIASMLGPKIDPVMRATHAVLHVLESSVEAGHVCLPFDTVVEQTSSLDVLPADVLRALVTLEKQGRIVTDGAPVDGRSRRVVYLRGLHVAETFVARRLETMANRQPSGTPWRAEQDLARIESELGLTLDERQREAVKATLSSSLLVVTGGPGTGKTTIVRAMVAMAQSAGIRMLLAAPTGRAAQRLQEATGHEARTLHRWLEALPPDMRYRRNRDNPVEADVVLIDEASMVDLPLFAALLDAMPAQATLVLMGDVNQLPPVRAGRVLWSIVSSSKFRVIALERVFRQSTGSMIPVNAQRILAGRMPLFARGKQAESADFFFLPTQDPEETARVVVELASVRLPRRYGLDPVSDILVLTPTHRGPAGVSALNERLRARLNPAARLGTSGGHAWRVGDKVLQTRNNYERDLFNGDIGRVVTVSEQTVRVDFGGRVHALSRPERAGLELAYALTVHKAQGSEAPAVVLALGGGTRNLLRRELLYTAVTRARRLVVLVGSPGALEQALACRGEDDRLDRLGERLRTG